MPDTRLIFETYRYQLSPLTSKIQYSFKYGDEDFEIESADELKKRKNEIVARILAAPSFSVTSRQSEVRTKLLHKLDEIFVFRLGVRRSAHIFSEDFRKSDIPNWPNFLVVFCNDPEIQKIAIQRTYGAFQTTQAIATILKKSLENHLRRFQLGIQVGSISEKQEFWKIIQRYQGKIVHLKFDLISPNLASMSKAIQPTLRGLLLQQKAQLNANRVGLDFTAPVHSALTIEKNNKLISSAAEYASQGGGEGTLRIRGYSKKIKTAESTTEITVDSIVLDKSTPEVVAEFRRLLT